MMPRWLLVAGGLLAVYGAVELVVALVQYWPAFVEQVEDSRDSVQAGGPAILPPA